MNRRIFLKETAIKGGGLVLGASLIPASVFAQQPIRLPAPDDFEILEKNDPDANSLEEVLVNGSQEIPLHKEFPKGTVIPTVTKFPSLFYVFDIKSGVSPGGCEAKHIPIDVGLCTILNKKGYFLTVAHGLNEFVGRNDRMALIYDTHNGMVRQPEILAYSKRDDWDIALGKVVNSPKAYDKSSTVNITRGNITKGNLVHSSVPNQGLYTSCDFVNEILDVPETGAVLKSADEWNWTQINSIANPIQRPEDGGLFFRIYSPIEMGYSGMALFSARHNDICGVLIRAGGECTGPESIRVMLNKYIAANKWDPAEGEASERSE